MKTLIITGALLLSTLLNAQSLSKELYNATKSNNVTALKKQLNNSQINDCLTLYPNKDYTVLSLAIKANAQQNFKYLLSQKEIDINKNCNGKTPAQYAAKYGHLDMLKQLIAKGADLTSKINGRSTLDYAKKYKQEHIVTYLSKR